MVSTRIRCTLYCTDCTDYIFSEVISLVVMTTYVTCIFVALSTLTIDIHSYAIRLLHGDNVHHGYTYSTEYIDYKYTSIRCVPTAW